MKYKVEWGTSPFASNMKYKGDISLNSNKKNKLTYYVKDTPRKANKKHTCSCCKRVINKEELYYIRVKEFYMERPRYFEDFKLCKNCAENT